MQTAKHILMDMDGVVVRGATVIPGAPEFIARLIAAGRRSLPLPALVRCGVRHGY